MPPIYSIIQYLNDDKKSKFKLTDQELKAFEQSEEAVVDFPLRKLSANPLKYRLYGRAYTCCYEQVHLLFNDFPKDKITYVEIGRYYSINQYDEFYKIFVTDIVKRENMRWIVIEENVDELTSLGIPKKNMTVKTR